LKIDTVKRLVVEDFPVESRAFVQKLAVVLNPFLDSVTTCLTSNITADNLKGKVWSIDLPIGKSTSTVAWDLNETPTNVQITKLALSTGLPPAAAFALSWSYANKQVTLTFLGLDASKAHKTTIEGRV
jgi:hypothetical protein